MVRKQVYLTGELDEKVKRLASGLSVAEAEIIRLALENLPEYRVAPASGKTLRETATLPYGAKVMSTNEEIAYGLRIRRALNRGAWERVLEQISKRASSVESSEGGRTWTRDELYDERLNRFSR